MYIGALSAYVSTFDNQTERGIAERERERKSVNIIGPRTN